MEDPIDKLFITDTIIRGGKWVFFSNSISANWPFSRKETGSRLKYLNFQLPTFGLFLSSIFILLNISFTIQYFFYDMYPDKIVTKVDAVCFSMFDVLPMVVIIVYRVYGTAKLSKFHLFWNEIVKIVTECTTLSSKEETLEKFRKLNRWGLKWVIVYGFFGLSIFCVSFYENIFVSNIPIVPRVFLVYLEIVLGMHTSGIFLLIFFLKIMRHGFSITKTALEKMPSSFKESFEVKRDDDRLLNMFELINAVERCVKYFNKFFGLILMLETLHTYSQIILCTYYMYVNLDKDSLMVVLMLIEITMSISSFVFLCVAGSNLASECDGMAELFQELPLSKFSLDEQHKVELKQDFSLIGKYISQYFLFLFIKIIDSATSLKIFSRRIPSNTDLQFAPHSREFIGSFVDLVEKFNELVSQEEIEERFKVIKRWGFKWVFGFGLLASISIAAGAYYFLYASQSSPGAVSLVGIGYMFFVVCTSNARAFLLIFFMKIITCGFSVCKTALQQASIEAEANTNDLILMEYIKRPTPGHKFGKSGYPDVNNFATKNKLDKILKLVEKSESSVAHFNSLFGFILFVEVVLGVLQILFSMYFLHLDSVAQDITYYVIMVMQFTIYAVSVICLCIAASRLTMEAEDMIRKFQNLPSATLSLDVYKVC
ncbi:unnamed protein product [Orchesella dallaii]|uniref:Gustatory receptor n=1 Tax=Orchesella dallaii TaxID=48710 RepID=A0ABP1Q0L2_9HEXA